MKFYCYARYCILLTLFINIAYYAFLLNCENRDGQVFIVTLDYNFEFNFRSKRNWCMLVTHYFRLLTNVFFNSIRKSKIGKYLL